MTIPQVRGPIRTVLLILVMVPIGVIATSEKHSLKDIGSALQHGIPLAIYFAAGWVFFKSPWSAEFQGIMQTTDTKTTKASGTVIEHHTETTIIPATKGDPQSQDGPV